MSGDEAIRRRLEALESQAAFQDELLTRLNEVVARQDSELLEFRRQLKDVAARLHEVGEAVRHATADPGDEPPPHY